VEKETGREYACKIMDINGDPSEIEGPAMREATLREIAILRRVAGHPYISKNFWEMWKWEMTNKKII
jgi:phosphorylase kinase gamma subunit